RHVEDLSVGRYSHPVTAAIVSLFPHLFFGDEVEAAQPLGRADVELRGPCAGGYPLDVLGHLARRHVPRRNSLDELVSVINIEDQDTDSAVLHIIPNAGNSDVEQMLFLNRGVRLW